MDRTAFEPEPLYDKPHAVDLAQVMLVFLYFMLVSTSLGLGPRVLGWVEDQTTDLPVLADLEELFPVGTAYPIAVVLPAVVLLTIPYVAVVLQLGYGRRWARAAALLIAPAGAVLGIAGVLRTLGPVVALVLAPLWIAVALAVLGGLATRTGRQWFRQGGWAPWYLRYEVDQLTARSRPPRRRRRRTTGLDGDAD